MIMKRDLETLGKRQNERRGCPECFHVSLLSGKNATQEMLKGQIKLHQSMSQSLSSLHLLFNCGAWLLANRLWATSGGDLGHRGPPPRPSNDSCGLASTSTASVLQNVRLQSGLQNNFSDVCGDYECHVKRYKWCLDGCQDDGVLLGDASDIKTAAEKAGGASSCCFWLHLFLLLDQQL